MAHVPTAPTPPSPSGRRARALVAAGAYAALAVADTALAGHPDAAVRRWRRLTKPLLMPALATSFALATEDVPGNPGLMRTGTLAAQALSGAGDVALLGDGDQAFLAGLGSFFGAHIAYVAAFAGEGRPWSDRTHLGGVTAAATAFATLGPTLGWAAGRRAPELRWPVVAYAGILTSMVGASSRLGEHVSPSIRRTVTLGTVTFLASDATIALRRFVLQSPTPRSDAVVMGTYTAGQGLIAIGVGQALRTSRRERGVATPRSAAGPRHRPGSREPVADQEG